MSLIRLGRNDENVKCGTRRDENLAQNEGLLEDDDEKMEEKSDEDVTVTMPTKKNTKSFALQE